MTNHERADRLLAEAAAIAEEARHAVERRRWNLAARRAQEVVELIVKGLLNEMGSTTRAPTMRHLSWWQSSGAATWRRIRIPWSGSAES